VLLKPSTCADAVMVVADENRFHPIRDYLDGLVWDCMPRLSGWIETYLGATVPDGKTEDEHAEATAKRTYIREVSQRWPISAVARIYKPGCKADCALIEEGPQGAGKSSALAALVPNPDWFADEISDLGSKDSAQDLRGKWIIELAELSAMKRGDIERTKAFMSRATDHYRPSYGRRSQDFPRQCVFAGTTNSDTYFGDETGNRRFWPVKVGIINLEALRRDRDQLWAEAVAAFKAGEKWWLDREIEKVAAEEQAERRIVDPWEQPLLEWAGRQVNPVSMPEALTALSVPVERHDQASANRVARIFKVAGWEKAQRRVAGVRVWVYRLSQVSQVGADETCDSQPTEKDREFPAVTGVTGVTGSSHAHKGTSPPPGSMDFNKQGGGVPAGNFSKNGGDTCDTCDRAGEPDHPSVFTPSADWQWVPDGAILPPGLQVEVDLATGRKRARLAPSQVPPWTDDRAWIAEIARAPGRDAKISKVMAWGQAAGGDVCTANGTLGIVLPPSLKKGMALNELHRFARELHIEVSMGGRA
jgi:predicted P-loop ATPase